MEELIKQALNQDPRAYYLQELGKSINTLCQKEHESYFFNTDKSQSARKNWIDDLHNKAMEVIKTIETKKP